MGSYNPRILRSLAAEAKLTPIGPEDDVTYAGNGLLVIHALPPGDKTLRWQGPCDVVDLTQGETVARQVESITIRMHAQEARWFQRGSAAERE